MAKFMLEVVQRTAEHDLLPCSQLDLSDPRTMSSVGAEFASNLPACYGC
jgi:hypothetical protein